MLVSASCKWEAVIKIEVKDNNVDQALRALKRKLDYYKLDNHLPKFKRYPK